MSHRAAVHQLESDFADAMNRLYTVGNGLAALRSELDREAAATGRGPRRPVAASRPRSRRPRTATDAAAGATRCGRARPGPSPATRLRCRGVRRPSPGTAVRVR